MEALRLCEVIAALVVGAVTTMLFSRKIQQVIGLIPAYVATTSALVTCLTRAIHLFNTGYVVETPLYVLEDIKWWWVGILFLAVTYPLVTFAPTSVNTTTMKIFVTMLLSAMSWLLGAWNPAVFENGLKKLRDRQFEDLFVELSIMTVTLITIACFSAKQVKVAVRKFTFRLEFQSKAIASVVFLAIFVIFYMLEYATQNYLPAMYGYRVVTVLVRVMVTFAYTMLDFDQWESLEDQDRVVDTPCGVYVRANDYKKMRRLRQEAIENDTNTMCNEPEDNTAERIALGVSYITDHKATVTLISFQSNRLLENIGRSFPMITFVFWYSGSVFSVGIVPFVFKLFSPFLVNKIRVAENACTKFLVLCMFALIGSTFSLFVIVEAEINKEFRSHAIDQIFSTLTTKTNAEIFLDSWTRAVFTDPVFGFLGLLW